MVRSAGTTLTIGESTFANAKDAIGRDEVSLAAV
jgi:hypothetical protein